MRPIDTNKGGQVIDLTQYCTGRINRQRRPKLGLWIVLGMITWAIIGGAVAFFI